MTNPECATSHDLAVTDIGCDLDGYPVMAPLMEVRPTQSKMVERVARAIYEDRQKREESPPYGWWLALARDKQPCISAARAAIAAMCEPTEAMPARTSRGGDGVPR